MRENGVEANAHEVRDGNYSLVLASDKCHYKQQTQDDVAALPTPSEVDFRETTLTGLDVAYHYSTEWY